MALPHRSLVFCLLTPSFTTGCEGSGSIAGAWEVVERQYTRTDSSWTESDPQPSSYLFLPSGYYGVQEIRESGPRPLFTESTTDVERLAAFDVFHAHSGAWRVVGDSLWITLQLAKSPNSMTGDTVGYRITWVGPDLVLTRSTPTESRSTRLRRLGGSEGE